MHKSSNTTLIKYMAIIVSSSFNVKLKMNTINILTIKDNLVSIKIAMSKAAVDTGIIKGDIL